MAKEKVAHEGHVGQKKKKLFFACVITAITDVWTGCVVNKAPRSRVSFFSFFLLPPPTSSLHQSVSAMALDLHHPFAKIANVIVYLTLLSGTLYSTFAGGASPDHESYISPAAFTFYIWTVIHFLLGGMIVYQWFTDKVYDAVRWHFVTASIFNAIWLALWVSSACSFSFAQCRQKDGWSQDSEASEACLPSSPRQFRQPSD